MNDTKIRVKKLDFEGFEGFFQKTDEHYKNKDIVVIVKSDYLNVLY